MNSNNKVKLFFVFWVEVDIFLRFGRKFFFFVIDILVVYKEMFILKVFGRDVMDGVELVERFYFLNLVFYIELFKGKVY